MKKTLIALSTLLLLPLVACAEGETISPNMQLIVPAVGITSGPQWAADLVLSLDRIDAHDHSTGNGVPITPAGLNITSDLSMQSNDLTMLRSTRFDPQASTFSLAADVGAVYVSGVDLYYRDVNGNNIRLTQTGSIVGTAGSISGLTPPASASYVPGNSTFVWQSAINTSANIDAACLLQRNLTASSNAITLCAPNALAANYSLTWPAALPASQKFATIDNTGNIAANWAVDGSTIEVSSNTVQVKALGIGTAQLANGSVTGPKLSALNYQVSSSSGNFLTSVTSPFTDITNLTVTITTTGRPVHIGIQSAGVSSNVQGSYIDVASNTAQWRFRYQRDGSNIATYRMIGEPPSFDYVDVIAAGTYIYKAQVQADSGSQVDVSHYVLFAYEM